MYGSCEYGADVATDCLKGDEVVTWADVDEGGLDDGEAPMSSVEVVYELTEGLDAFPSSLALPNSGDVGVASCTLIGIIELFCTGESDSISSAL